MCFSLIYATLLMPLFKVNPLVCLSFGLKTWTAILYLGILASATAYMLWFRALSVMPVARVVIFQFLQPVSGIVVSYFIVGERFTLWLFIGAAMIAYGVALVNRR
jgi:drug/metabolite transporter (DMT)-like permease